MTYRKTEVSVSFEAFAAKEYKEFFFFLGQIAASRCEGLPTFRERSKTLKLQKTFTP
jgi:hypothetical protein